MKIEDENEGEVAGCACMRMLDTAVSMDRYLNHGIADGGLSEGKREEEGTRRG